MHHDGVSKIGVSKISSHNVGGEREKEREVERERKNLLHALRRTTRRRGEEREVEPRSLINETYAAAADTEMHCKYSAPHKKKLLSPDEIYTCPNYDLASKRSTFFRPSNNSLGAPFLRQCSLDNGADLSLQLHLHETTNARLMVLG